MQPWLSSGVLRYAIVLSFGWVSLGAIVVAMSGTIADETATGQSRPGLARAVRFDQADPCTLDPIALDAQLFVKPTARVDVDVIYTDALVTLTGWLQAGPTWTGRRLSIEEHHRFLRTLLLGVLGPSEMFLRLVERPTQQDTLLAIRLQPIWNGSDQTVTVSETHLACD
jgi:hypothetical protein